MDKTNKLDIVFIICSNQGQSFEKTDLEISRVARHLTKSIQDCRIASIHFKQDYNSRAGVTLFCNHVSDFSNFYCDRKSNEGNPLQYGYPLQHVANLSFREDATKICFLVSNILPFNDSCEETIIYKNEINNENECNESPGDRATENNKEDKPNQPQNPAENTLNTDENTANVKPSQSKNNVLYHEDALHSCRAMAAMGVVLYCIETVSHCTMYKDMYDALSYITGGQYLNVHDSQLAKAIKAAILEEVSLEKLVGYVRDYLCVAWLAWGTMKAKKPSSLQELTDNVNNYLHNINITTSEMLIGDKPLKIPSKQAKKIAKLTNVAEARSMKAREENWAAEISWVMPEICNEVIPGYDTPQTGKTPKNNIKKVTISEYKRVPRNQTERITIRTLARRPAMIGKQEQVLTVPKMCSNKVEKCSKNDERRENVQEVNVGKEREIACQEKWAVSCKQEIIAEKLTRACAEITCKKCVLV